MPRTEKRSSVRVRRRLTAVTVLVCALALTGAPAALISASAKTRRSNARTFTLPGHTTRTFTIGYPAALKHKGARYTCTVGVSGLGRRYVRILSRGSALGGSVCRVRARNNAKLPSLDPTARLRITATTTY